MRSNEPMASPRSSGEDEAVSQVIGVILMVALTVILASVVGTFVLDFSSLLQEPVQAGVDVDEDYNSNLGQYEVTFTLTSLNNANEVYVKKGTSQTSSMTDVGDSVTIVASEGDRLTVVASNGERDQVQQIIEVGR